MPCYCDSPDEDDQVEIEERAKTRMYFDALCLLTDEQIKKCKKRDIKKIPVGDVNEHLCKLCKILNEEQMKEVSAFCFNIKWPHQTLYDWHLKHIEDDKANNPKN